VSSADIASAILRDAPELLSHIRADVPDDLQRIVSRCLEKNPRERAQSALDLGNELRRIRRMVQSGETEAREKPSSEKTLSIAVLPFVNRSASVDDEYFSDSLADELLN